MPCHWPDGGLSDFRGRARFRRRFGYPGRIDAHERVWLTVGVATGRLRVALNGTLLGEQDGGGCEFDVTPLLRERNELSIEVEAGEAGGPCGETALEVRCTAYLHDVACGVRPGDGVSARVWARGVVAGTCAELLELYLLIDGSPAAYAALPPPVASRSFCLTADALSPERRAAAKGEPYRVRVDLVRAATIWYTWEGELTLEPHPFPQA
jgi:hypothetical protein